MLSQSRGLFCNSGLIERSLAPALREHVCEIIPGKTTVDPEDEQHPILLRKGIAKQLQARFLLGAQKLQCRRAHSLGDKLESRIACAATSSRATRSVALARPRKIAR